MSSPIIDPALAQALAPASNASAPLNVFVKVCLPKDATTPIERASKVADLIKRVQQRSQVTPKFQFRDLDSVLQVKAPSTFVRQLLDQPEVLAASTVPNFGSAMMEPVKRREVDAESIDRPVSTPRRTTPRARR